MAGGSSVVAVEIPRSSRAPLLDLIRMPEKDRTRLLEALRREKPHLNPETLAERVAPAAGVPVETIARFFSVLGSLYLSLVRAGIKFDESLVPALQRSLQPEGGARAQLPSATLGEPTLEQLESFRKFAVEALGLQSALGKSLKGWALLTDAERPYSGARILSDVRNIFSDGTVGSPQAAVVVHTLRINYTRVGENMRSLFVEMDIKDLENLKSVVERAIRKDEELRKFFGSQLTVLEQ